MLLAALAGLAGAWASSPAATDAGSERLAPLAGEVRLLSRSGSRPARSVSPLDAVVFFRPAAESPVPRPASAVVFTRGKQFQPRVTVVPVGSEVTFPNRDPILHNVFSVSGRNAFDLELYGEGEARATRFHHDGLVRVFCNVHRDMVTYVWVADTPYVARPAADGSFRLDVPPGPGTLTVWHERSDPVEVEVTVAERGLHRPLELRITRPRVPRHLDKTGRPYGRGRDVYR